LDQNEIDTFNRIFPLSSRSTLSVSDFLYEKINEINSNMQMKSIRNKIFKHVCPKSLNEFDQQILQYFKTISQGVPQLMDGKMN
jgi:thiamine kinase-like enzyme